MKLVEHNVSPPVTDDLLREIVRRIRAAYKSNVSTWTSCSRETNRLIFIRSKLWFFSRPRIR